MADEDRGPYERIYGVVRRIPRGRVATYGQVASLAGLGGHARQVGYALHALTDDRRLPWHRVVNAAGRVSARSEPGGDHIQRELLRREGVRFDAADRIDLALEPGMVIAVEPKAFGSQTGPVGVEDVYVVTQTGCERLCPLPHDLIRA